jgi:hypothetical protein
MICWSLEMYFAELFFFEELFRKPENFSDDALSLPQRLMADFILLNARGQLLEVIFLSVQVEAAQYILDIINNIFSVGIVENGVVSYL